MAELLSDSDVSLAVSMLVFLVRVDFCVHLDFDEGGWL
jgi:hypothetical protein